MQNVEIARCVEEVADLLEVQRAILFLVQAHRRRVRLSGLTDDADEPSARELLDVDRSTA